MMLRQACSSRWVVFIAIALGLLPTLICCKTRSFESTKTKSLENMIEFGEKELLPNRSLGFARAKGIAHSVFRIRVDNDDDSKRNFIYRVQFGKISQANYTLLMERYHGQNFVGPWSAERDYWLEDFLPPKMQAYVNRWLFPQSEVKTELPWQVGDFRSESFQNQTPPESTVGMNCWTTALDILRDIGLPVEKQEAKFFYVNADQARIQIEANLPPGQKFASFPLALKDKTAEIRNQGRNFGDLLYIKTQFQPFGPAHVAIWIDEDFYFEKTNFSEDDPIRLAFFDDVIEPYLDQDSADHPLEFRFYPQNLKNNPQDKDAAIPMPEKFAGDYPFDEVPTLKEGEKVTTRDQVLQILKNKGILGKYFFTLDTGLGGGLTAYSISTLFSAPLIRDEATGRAKIENADKLSSFQSDDIFCRTHSSQFIPDELQKKILFSYTLSNSGQLTITSKATGTVVAKIKGVFVPENKALTIENGSTQMLIKPEIERKLLTFNGKAESILTTNRMVFPSRSETGKLEKVLSIFTKTRENHIETYIEHPGGVPFEIALKCDGDMRAFKP